MYQREPEKQNNSEIEPDISEAGVDELRQVLAEEKEKAEKYLANWQRSQADFANYRRRAEQDKEEFGKYANSSLLLSILPFVDDLERALTAVPDEITDNSWVDGVRLIKRKVLATLENQGVSAIEALGQPFDPHLHEAVRQDIGKEGTVLEEVQRGYMFRDKVLRPSLVVVGSGGVEQQQKE